MAVPVLLALAAAALAAALLLLVVLPRLRRPRAIAPGPYRGQRPEAPAYDVLIVGAGPAGATCAYFLRQDPAGLRVALLDKARFPRDKYCGEAWCTPALRLLAEMGLLEALERDGFVHDTATGGFIGPAGKGFVDMSGNRDTSARSAARTCSIPRIEADARIARRAQEAGAELLENHEVEHAELDRAAGLWTVRTGAGVLKCRMLVVADGSPSVLAQKLGLFRSEPTGFCTRHLWRGGTHRVRADGVMYFPRYMLPGYFALFKGPGDDVYLGAYLLPGGRLGERDLLAVHKHALEHDGFIRGASPLAPGGAAPVL